MMSRYSRYALAALLFLCGGSLRAQGTLEIVGGDTHDWGNVPPGKLTAVVELKNIGAGELNIAAVRPTCLCTVAPIDKNQLKPGEVAHVNITLDATSKTGPLERNIVIHSSDSAAPQRTLHLKATIKRDLTLTPSSYLTVDNAVKDVEAPAAPIVITNSSGAPLTLYPPGAPQGNFKARFNLLEPKELKPGEQFELKAFITPLVVSGMSGTVKMKTTSQQMQFVDLTVVGTAASSDAGHSH